MVISWRYLVINPMKLNMLEMPCSQSILRWKVICTYFMLAAVIFLCNRHNAMLHIFLFMVYRLAQGSRFPDLQTWYWKYIYDQLVWRSETSDSGSIPACQSVNTTTVISYGHISNYHIANVFNTRCMMFSLRMNKHKYTCEIAYF